MYFAISHHVCGLQWRSVVAGGLVPEGGGVVAVSRLMARIQ